MEKFAYKINAGDKLNMYCEGWKVVKYINKGFMIEVVFEDGTQHKFAHSERVFAV